MPTKRKPVVAEKALSLAITDTHYVPITSDGYWNGTYFEGALGCVVEALHNEEGAAPSRQKQLALKVPRFLADSDRENAYIDSRFREEVKAAEEFQNKSALVEAKGTMLFSDRRLPTDTAPPPSRIVLIRFEKGRPPRMCAAQRTADSITVVPDLPDHVRPLAVGLQELFQVLSRPPVMRTYVCPTGAPPEQQPTGRGIVRLLENELPAQSKDAPWYAFPPSILFSWYPSTLEQLLSQNFDEQGMATSMPEAGSLQHFEDKLRLVVSILEGVVALHGNNPPMLHNDIRSANVLIKDGECRLGDYGSMSFSGPFAGPGTGGGTLESVKLTPERSAPFYSAERRSGQEIESVNTACAFWKEGSGSARAKTGYLVVAGFQDDLLQAPKVPTDLVNRIRGSALPGLESWTLSNSLLALREDQDALKKGDRIRLRDIVFTVRHELKVLDQGAPTSLRVFACDAPYSRIMHGSIPVRNKDQEPADPEMLELRVPSLVELRQWSAATDLFGVGVAALDICFRGGRVNQDRKDGPKRFEELVRHMELRSYFEYQWPRLDRLRRDLLRVGEPAAPGIAALEGDVRRVVTGIGSMTPHANELLANLGNNGAHFVLLMHFVLCCMHRAEAYAGSKIEALLSHGDSCPPFSASRCDAAKKDGSASKALNALERAQRSATRKAPLSSEDAIRAFHCTIGEFQGPEELSEQLTRLKRIVRTASLVAAVVFVSILAGTAYVLWKDIEEANLVAQEAEKRTENVAREARDHIKQARDGYAQALGEAQRKGEELRQNAEERIHSMADEMGAALGRRDQEGGLRYAVDQLRWSGVKDFLKIAERLQSTWATSSLSPLAAMKVDNEERLLAQADTALASITPGSTTTPAPSPGQ